MIVHAGPIGSAADPVTDGHRHLVVFDVNVYLDAAFLTGAPFSWESFDAIAASIAQVPVPHSDGDYDSLRAIATCQSGTFAGLETVEVFTNDHIEDMVHAKAQHPVVPAPGSDLKGLGWSRSDADALLEEFVWEVGNRSSGGCVPTDVPDGNPPLDHEDGMVYGACKYLAGEDPLATVYCVTRDRPFLEAARLGKLSGHTKVLHPSKFVGLVRAARASLGVKRIRPGGPAPQ